MYSACLHTRPVEFMTRGFCFVREAQQTSNALLHPLRDYGYRLMGSRHPDLAIPRFYFTGAGSCSLEVDQSRVGWQPDPEFAHHLI